MIDGGDFDLPQDFVARGRRVEDIGKYQLPTVFQQCDGFQSPLRTTLILLRSSELISHLRRPGKKPGRIASKNGAPFRRIHRRTLKNLLLGPDCEVSP